MREGKNEKNGDWKVGIFIVSFSLAMGISIWASAAVGHNEANNNPLTAAQDHISELQVRLQERHPGIPGRMTKWWANRKILGQRPEASR